MGEIKMGPGSEYYPYHYDGNKSLEENKTIFYEQDKMDRSAIINRDREEAESEDRARTLNKYIEEHKKILLSNDSDILESAQISMENIKQQGFIFRPVRGEKRCVLYFIDNDGNFCKSEIISEEMEKFKNLEITEKNFAEAGFHASEENNLEGQRKRLLDYLGESI